MVDSVLSNIIYPTIRVVTPPLAAAVTAWPRACGKMPPAHRRRRDLDVGSASFERDARF